MLNKHLYLTPFRLIALYYPLLSILNHLDHLPNLPYLPLHLRGQLTCILHHLLLTLTIFLLILNLLLHLQNLVNSLLQMLYRVPHLIIYRAPVQRKILQSLAPRDSLGYFPRVQLHGEERQLKMLQVTISQYAVEDAILEHCPIELVVLWLIKWLGVDAIEGYELEMVLS